MGIFDDDVDAVVADLAGLGETVTLVIGLESVEAIRDIEGRNALLQADVQFPADALVLLIVPGGLAGLAIDAACTVDDVAYVVRRYDTTDDGRLTRVVVVPA